MPGCLQRPIAEAVVPPGEADHSRLAVVQQRGLQCRLDGLGAGIRQEGFACSQPPAFKGDATERLAKIRLERSRMHISHGVEQYPAWARAASRTTGAVWPRFATANAPVKSRYRFPSASQTLAPSARSQKMGNSGSSNVTPRAS